MPIAVVVIQDRLAVAGHQQVDKTVVIVVSRGHGVRVHIRIESRLDGDIGEMPSAVVPIKMIVRRNGRLLFQRVRMHRIIERPAVRDIEIGHTIVVVVEPDTARAGAFEK